MAPKTLAYLDLGVGLPAAFAGELVPPVAEHPAVEVCHVGGGTGKHDEVGDTGGSPVCGWLVNMLSRSGAGGAIQARVGIVRYGARKGGIRTVD